MRPRRFAGMLEFDRNGPPLEGTPEQREAIRTLVDEVLVWGSPFHRTMQAMDRQVNREGRRFIPVSFYPLHQSDLVGFCWPNQIQLGEQLLPTRQAVGGIFLHELGHLVGWKLKPWHGGTDTHGMNEAFKEWVLAGQPEDSEVWSLLRPALVHY